METARNRPATLGIDTATDVATTAAAARGGVLSEREAEPLPGGGPRHASALLACVEEVVAEAGGWAEIGLIGVGIGPGSFTGLRIGIATARALAQATGIPIAPVGSLDALDLALARRPDAAGRPRLAALDARRGELFAQLRDADAALRWGPVVASPDRLAELLGAPGPPPLAAGSGSLRFRHELEAAGADVVPAEAPEHRIAARHVCELAVTADAGPPEAIEPIYLRRPDAELWRERDRDARSDGSA